MLHPAARCWDIPARTISRAPLPWSLRLVPLLSLDFACLLQVVELDAEPMPLGPQNPHGIGFVTKATVLETEQQAQRMADTVKSRAWKVSWRAGGRGAALLLLRLAWEARPGPCGWLLLRCCRADAATWQEDGCVLLQQAGRRAGLWGYRDRAEPRLALHCNLAGVWAQRASSGPPK